MISYKFDEEPRYVEYYASKLDDSKIVGILESDSINSAEEAILLSEFFWKMVESSIEDEKSGIKLPWKEGAEFWNEKIMNSFSAYLEKSGFENEWDRIVDKQ